LTGLVSKTFDIEAWNTRHSEPAISVVVAVHDDSARIEGCLASIARATPASGAIEVIAIDDASTDDSVDRIEQAAAAFPFALKLVRKRPSTGVADTRNVGITQAQGRSVFILDAAHWIHPDCLRDLEHALRLDGQAAVFGVVRRVSADTDEPMGLASIHEWNVERLLERPYLHSIAMFDRERLMAVGGYSSGLRSYEWFGGETYDLWLKLAAADAPCRLVPSIVATCRVEDRPTSFDDGTLASLGTCLHQKFHALCRRYPGLDTYFGLPTPWPRPDPLQEQQRIHDEELRSVHDAWSSEVDAMHRSWSWRITAPVRIAARLMARRRN
jgi:hypothetical protein